MAQPAPIVEEDYEAVLSRYLKALARNPSPRSAPSPGHDVRTCQSCGTRATFTLDPEGTWYRCTRCGSFG